MAMMLTNNGKANSTEFTLLLRLTVIISFLLNKIMLHLKLFAVTFLSVFFHCLFCGQRQKKQKPNNFRL